MSDYQSFLASKTPRAISTGIEPASLPGHLFDFQQACVDFCIRQGRAGLYLDTGLGKTRTGMPDYLLVFRNDGENAEPIEHTPGEFPVDQWQQWASPVWMDIQQTNTLNVRVAKDDKDEKHLCPLQLDLIERAVILWSNPGDVVLSPFMGIGSEGYVATKLKRKFVGVELKESYWRQAVKHLQGVEAQSATLFDQLEAVA